MFPRKRHRELLSLAFFMFSLGIMGLGKQEDSSCDFARWIFLYMIFHLNETEVARFRDQEEMKKHQAEINTKLYG
jgi:hypothetical protein